jgi:hypothetical protein
MQVGQNFHHHNTESQKWVNFITMLNKSSESSNCIQEEIFLKLKTLPGLMNNKHDIDTHQSLTPQGLQDKT